MKDPILYKIVVPLIGIWFRITYSPKFINKKVIPKKGSAVIAGNHVSNTDFALVIGATRRCIAGVAKAELFKKGIARWFFTGIGAIPVDRKAQSNDVVAKCVEVLKNGRLVALMPEGTVNRTEEALLPFKTGAVRMALESNCPIIPFAIIADVKNNYNSFKRGVKIVFGESYYPETDDITKETEILRNKVMTLINENRVI